MATAAPPGISMTGMTDDERRWLVTGICLHKLLTPRLRTILGKEMLIWHNKLCLPPWPINAQTRMKHLPKLPPSKKDLNYSNINNNSKLKKGAYDYNVKDPESLAKLFVQPFMAKFSGFDQTMDLSAVLSIICEADPFHTSGAAAQAEKVRSVVRNEWAHCNFSKWDDVNYRACIQEIESLVKKLNMTNADEKDFVDKLNNWRDKGVLLCCGQAVDDELLKFMKTDFSYLYDSIKIWRGEVEGAHEEISERLQLFNSEIRHLYESQTIIEKSIQQLTANQDSMSIQYETTSKQLDVLENKVAKFASGNGDVPVLFMMPERTDWFSGRELELQTLHNILWETDDVKVSKVRMAAVCGLGGTGKTSLVTEYTHRWKEEYDGGIFWFSGEDESAFDNSVIAHAVYLGTSLETSTASVLAKTLEVISRNEKLWLVVLDDMDEYKICSNINMLLSGPWKRMVRESGHILITTRREPKLMHQTIRGLKQSQCLQLECFNPEDGNTFVFKRLEGAGHPSNLDDEMRSQASDLVQTLGGLPLALEQACAYIIHLSCSLASYLQQYNECSLRLLKEHEASPTSHYQSSQRLAVHTTWQLNFEYIKQSPHGKFAARFLNACAFFNSSEIQKKLINEGKPEIEDDAFREFVREPTALGPLQILKLLTDFSLFKENRDSCLTVHRLVQEVIRDNLKKEDYVTSLVDAIRFLCHAFSTSRSPDDLVTSVVRPHHGPASLQTNDPSLFHMWHKMCLHAHEIRKFVFNFLETSNVLDRRITVSETARIVYQCALHFNVYDKVHKAKETVDFAYKIIILSGNTSLSTSDLAGMFPHKLPLPQIVRRFISNSCITPPHTKSHSTVVHSEDAVRISVLKQEGNRCFKDGNFQKAVEIYTSAITQNEGTSSFDPIFLSNRSSANIKLGKFEDALRDAEDYISHRPSCFKGYARKALALHGLKMFWGAAGAAAIASYFEPSIFRTFPPFQNLFPTLEERITICRPDVTPLLQCHSSRESNQNLPGKILVFKPGNYVFHTCNIYISNCILIGVKDVGSERNPLLSFKEVSMHSSGCVMGEDIAFAFDTGCWTSEARRSKFTNCSFTTNRDVQAFLSMGDEHFTKCTFHDSKEDGLRIRGKALVEKCVFSGNYSIGVQVSMPGEFEIKNSQLFANKLAIHVGQDAGFCRIIGCEIYGNHYQGIGLYRNSKIEVINNRIYHNDRHGIFLEGESFTRIEGNEIYENCWKGIATLDNARCDVIKNKIYRNKHGGVQVVPIGPGPESCHSVVENNEIFENRGPAIYDEMMFKDSKSIPKEEIFNEHLSYFRNFSQMRKARCEGNKEANNGQERSENEGQRFNFCSCCGKKKKQLQSCTGCYSVEYCNKECQKEDWVRHKKVCSSIGKESSVVVDVLPKQGLPKGFSLTFNEQAPGLDPKGPKYADSPKYGKRFVVKLQAVDGERLSNFGGALFTIYDRSMTIHGDLAPEHCHLYDTVLQCGKETFAAGWRKMFFWALLCNSGDYTPLRILTKPLPPFQNW